MAQKDDMEEKAGQVGGWISKKKIAAAGALGVAVPAAVGVARKLMGNGSDGGEDETSDATASRDTGSSGASQTRSRSASRSSGGGSRQRSSAGSRASGGGSKRKSSSGGSKRKSASGGSSRGKEKTKEQLYAQAQRLKIEGRSSMNKAQLERAVSRARS